MILISYDPIDNRYLVIFDCLCEARASVTRNINKNNDQDYPSDKIIVYDIVFKNGFNVNVSYT